MEQQAAPLTTKQIKKLARPEFEKNPERFYPTKVFQTFNFIRDTCKKCNHFYWHHPENQSGNCGDSNCSGTYGFIGNGRSQEAKAGKIMTFAEAWKGFERSLTSARIPCTSIDRYPVVARWRTDVEFVAAGIYCFQPYCVTGEIEPPANPLICPQFCVRFNDLNNIGITGRHYSGFIMLGIQVFNTADKFVFFSEECVEFNHRWLTEELKIDPREITYVEDVWAGGGNLGPSIEYFIGGLELGNMVFMTYKVLPDGSREELPVKVIDVGIGLERVAWLLNGSPTSYVDTFRNALNFLLGKLNMTINDEIWGKFGPYSCLLDVDECEDIDKTWISISEKINVPVEKIKEAMAPVKDLYIILDHTRSAFLIIYDGYLPGNVGGGSNIRNLLRRSFSILHNNGWLPKFGGIKEFLEIIEYHKKDLEDIYGAFKDTQNIRDIVSLEYEKWLNTEKETKSKFDKFLKDKKKDKAKKDNKDVKNIKDEDIVLSTADWIFCMETWGVSPDTIQAVSKQEVPKNLYEELENKNEEKNRKKQMEQQSINESILSETDSLFYSRNEERVAFRGKVLNIASKNEIKHANPTNKDVGDKENNKKNIFIFDRSSFYPTSGGQEHDTGVVTVNGKTYKVINVEKEKKCVLHHVEEEITDDRSKLIGAEVYGQVDQNRRKQLMAHHTGTHIVFAACKRVLGNHIWQNGAHKTTEEAHLDITHFKLLSYEQEKEIEREANRIVLEGINIDKYHQRKAEAEKEHGFVLYQGGVVPGNELRIVNINNTDVEACCGTHCDNTREVGIIKMISTHKLSDGVVRLTYVAGDRALEEINRDSTILHDLCNEWGGIQKGDLVKTGIRFFKDYKHYSQECSKQEQLVFDYQMRILLSPQYTNDLVFVKSTHNTPTFYLSAFGNYFKDLNAQKKGIIFYNSEFIHMALGQNNNAFNVVKLKNLVQIRVQEAEKDSLEKEMKKDKEVDQNKADRIAVLEKTIKHLASEGENLDLANESYGVKVKIMDKLKGADKSVIPNASTCTFFFPRVQVEKVAAILTENIKGIVNL